MEGLSALSLLQEGLNQCAIVIERDGGLLLSLLIAGLVGGISHCAGMCGPFVLAQVTSRLERVSVRTMTEMHRLTGAAVLPYHMGRATSYAVIGAVAAAVAGHVGALPGLRGLSAALLGFAALFFLGLGLRSLSAWFPVLAGSGITRLFPAATGSGRLGALVSRLAKPLFSDPTGLRGYGLGLALGFIPCGLLYGAVAVAAASGEVLTGALGMLAFSLGTIPSLLAVGIAGHVAGRVWGETVRRLAPLLLVINAGVLGWMAISLLAGR